MQHIFTASPPGNAIPVEEAALAWPMTPGPLPLPLPALSSGWRRTSTAILSLSMEKRPSSRSGRNTRMSIMVDLRRPDYNEDKCQKCNESTVLTISI
eukprot:scaffold442836_cov32-Prasinocladus_malaysianus.AAC.1